MPPNSTRFARFWTERVRRSRDSLDSDLEALGDHDERSHGGRRHGLREQPELVGEVVI